MSLLLCGEIRPMETVPDFGAALHEHLQRKSNPAIHASSVAAWSLLAGGLRTLGVEALPEVRAEALRQQVPREASGGYARKGTAKDAGILRRAEARMPRVRFLEYRGRRVQALRIVPHRLGS